MLDKPIRILHVVTSMNAGGIENMLMNLYRNIDRNKIQFDFLVHRRAKGFFDDEILSLKGRIYYVRPLSVVNIFSYYKDLNQFLNQYNYYKIIHSHISVWSYLILSIAKKNKIPIRIAHSHESHKTLWEHKLTRIPLIWSLRKMINRPLTHRLACAYDAGKWMFGKSVDFKVINNAIDVSKFKFNSETAENIRREFNLEDSLVIGHVGNFSRPKNYPFILKVFKEITRHNGKVKLLLVGNHKRNPKIANEVAELKLQDKVVFTGLRNDVYNLYQAMDVFLFPSHNEGLPVTLVEAQAAGLKIFASDAITREVALTDDIEFLSLNKSTEDWAEEILKSVPYNRKDNSKIIKDRGYDIVESAKWLENFYLNQY